MLDAGGVEAGRAADYSVNVIAFFKQKFRQKRAVLARDSCDESDFFRHIFSWLNAVQVSYFIILRVNLSTTARRTASA